MKSFPKFIMIQTTSFCNASCSFCPYPEIRNSLPHGYMEEELFQDIIKQCKGHRELEVIMPYLMNEPLMDKRLPERISYIKAKLPWVRVHILSNANLLDQDYAQRLIDSGIDWIGFSVHGILKETYEKTMGIDYEKTFTNISNFIKLAKKSGKDISRFIMVTFLGHPRLSEKEKEEIFNYWRSQGIKRISYFAEPISRAGNVKWLKRLKHKQIYGCNSIWTNEMLHILYDGRIVLCCMDWRREIILGDLKKESIEKVWNGSKYNRIRAMIRGEIPLSAELICQRCECAQTVPPRGEKGVMFLIFPPWGVDTPPVGMGCLVEVLTQDNIPLEVFDVNIWLYNKVEPADKYLWNMDQSLNWKNKDFLSMLMSKYHDVFEELKKILYSSKAQIFAISIPTDCMNLMVKWAINVIKQANPERIIILGGISVTIEEQREPLLKDIEDMVDYVIIGEGEASLLELIKNLRRNNFPDDLSGTIVLHGGKRIINPQQYTGIKLDHYPFPTYRNFPLESYRERSSIAVEWSRGCIGKCPFCDFSVLSKTYKKKSPQRVIAEIKYYIKNLKKTHFSIVDSSINADLKWLDEIVSYIIKDKIKASFSALAIPRGDMSESFLHKMRQAGFYRLEYGVESGSAKILKMMRKIFSPEDAEKCLQNSKKAGIKNVLYFIVGFPGEGEEEFNETLEFIKRNCSYIDFVKSVNPLFLMAGSELYEKRDNFAINLSKENPDIYWYTADGNDYSLRMARVERVKGLLKELAIPYSEEATALPKRKTSSSSCKDKRICLVTTPPWGVNNPPVGLAYLATYLRNQGYCPIVLDYNIHFFHRAPLEYRHLWHVENKNFWSDPQWFPIIKELFKEEIDSAVEEILATEAKWIGFSVVDPKERLTIEFIKRIKEKDRTRKIILGGPACLTAHSRKIFFDYIDAEVNFLVPGEGEEVLSQILRERGENIKGAFFRQDNKWRFIPRDLIQDLDTIPYPTYEDFDLKLYLGNSLILEWSRGCLGRCAFCINWVLIKGFRFRSAEHIFQELNYHVRKNRIRKFTICDPIINGNPSVLDRLCDFIISAKLDIEWTGEAAPRADMELDLLQKMYRAGCHKLQIGVESGSDRVLARMKKFYNVSIAEKFLRKASQAGMETEVFIMVGFPGEGEKEFEETVNFIKRNSLYIDTIKSINTMHLIAGSTVFERRSDYGIKPLPEKDWHYLWETEDGNTYQIRKERGEYLLKLAAELGIKVKETNLTEGKQKMEREKISLDVLKQKINKLQDLPQRRKLTLVPIKPRKRLIRLPYLILILGITLIVELYLWVLKKLRSWIIFPGS